MNYVKEFHINGVDTRQISCIELHGKPNAATEGCVGVLGIDLDSPLHDVYKCVAVNGSIFTWELLSSGLSIMSATISGGGAESVQFPYEKVLKPDTYVIKNGDLIIDGEGYLYQIVALNTTYCETKYTGTRVVAYGMSAYDLAVRNGFGGSLEDWFASLKGDPGITPHIGENGNWWFGKVDTMESAAGNTPWTLVEKYTTAGAYTWTCPKDGEYVAVIVGGGGSGAFVGKTCEEQDWSAHFTAYGGGAGKINFYRGQCEKGTQIPLVVGSGSVGGTFDYLTTVNGYDGGTSSFNGVTAGGGTGGKYNTDMSASFDNEVSPSEEGWGGAALFVDENNVPVTSNCSGGGVYASGGHSVSYINKGTERLPTAFGKTVSQGCGIGSSRTGGSVTPTDCGAGSGAVAALFFDYENTSNLSVTVGAGADGGVFIYKVRSRDSGDNNGDNNGNDGDDEDDGDDGESTIPENILSSEDGYLLTDMNGVFLMPA